MKQDQFYMLDIKKLKNDDLPVEELILFQLLDSVSEIRFTPSIQNLMNRTKWSKSKVRRYLANLRDKNLVIMHQEESDNTKLWKNVSSKFKGIANEVRTTSRITEPQVHVTTESSNPIDGRVPRTIDRGNLYVQDEDEDLCNPPVSTETQEGRAPNQKTNRRIELIKASMPTSITQGNNNVQQPKENKTSTSQESTSTSTREITERRSVNSEGTHLSTEVHPVGNGGVPNSNGTRVLHSSLRNERELSKDSNPKTGTGADIMKTPEEIAFDIAKEPCQIEGLIMQLKHSSVCKVMKSTGWMKQNLDYIIQHTASLHHQTLSEQR